jgi:superoxide dismutase, Fe-Mn family
VLASYNQGSPFDLPTRHVRDPNTGYNLDTTAGTKQVEDLRANRRHEYLILPLLGVNCWEHAYLPDYGVVGKEKYLLNWWTAINWQRVHNTFTKTAAEPVKVATDAEVLKQW